MKSTIKPEDPNPTIGNTPSSRRRGPRRVPAAIPADMILLSGQRPGHELSGQEERARMLTESACCDTDDESEDR